jgi:orotidine-5'-phosphate decarboxylase
MPHTFFLVPGYGAQGGRAEDLKGLVDQDGLGIIVNSSRGIIAAHMKQDGSGIIRDGFDERNFAAAARQAVLAMRRDLADAIGAGHA